MRALLFEDAGPDGAACAGLTLDDDGLAVDDIFSLVTEIAKHEMACAWNMTFVPLALAAYIAKSFVFLKRLIYFSTDLPLDVPLDRTPL